MESQILEIGEHSELVQPCPAPFDTTCFTCDGFLSPVECQQLIGRFLDHTTKPIENGASAGGMEEKLDVETTEKQHSNFSSAKSTTVRIDTRRLLSPVEPIDDNATRIVERTSVLVWRKRYCIVCIMFYFIFCHLFLNSILPSHW
jgi:hypothetical protein